MKRIDLGDKRFGKLTVVSFDHTDDEFRCFWNVKCDCGKEKVVNGSHLKSGNTKSCGCLHKEMTTRYNKEFNITHAMSHSSTYISWQSMKNRCCNINDQCYENYGRRGISVCDRWKDSFENFYKDMGDRPKGMTIDRINNDGNYEHGNCKWATQREQGNNRRTNVFLTYNNLKLTVAQWARKLDMPHTTILRRIKHGWDIGKILLPFRGG